MRRAALALLLFAVTLLVTLGALVRLLPVCGEPAPTVAVKYWTVKKRAGREYLHVYPRGFAEIRKSMREAPGISATPLPGGQRDPELAEPLQTPA